MNLHLKIKKKNTSHLVNVLKGRFSWEGTSALYLRSRQFALGEPVPHCTTAVTQLAQAVFDTATAIAATTAAIALPAPAAATQHQHHELQHLQHQDHHSRIKINQQPVIKLSSYRN